MIDITFFKTMSYFSHHKEKISLVRVFPIPLLFSLLHLSISEELFIVIDSNSFLSIFFSTQANQSFALTEPDLARSLMTSSLLTAVINSWSFIELSLALDTISYSLLFEKLPCLAFQDTKTLPSKSSSSHVALKSFSMPTAHHGYLQHSSLSWAPVHCF